MSESFQPPSAMSRFGKRLPAVQCVGSICPVSVILMAKGQFFRKNLHLRQDIEGSRKNSDA
jgi:hypothetical protein